MMVVETRDLPLIQEFLEKFPADKRRRMLQDQTRGGDTCLHLAAGLSRIESSQKVMLLRLLVTNGANGNIANNVKEFPKDFARYEVCLYMIKLICESTVIKYKKVIKILHFIEFLIF